MFGTSTFTTLSTGGAGNATDGQYLYGSSLTLTNFGLYALRGNNIGGYLNNQDRVIYAEHWVWKAAIFSPSTGAYLTPTTMGLLNTFAAGSTNIGGWTNTAGSPISACFQRWSSPGSSQNIFGYGTQIPGAPTPTSFAQPYEGPTSAFSSGGQTNVGASLVATSPDFWQHNWANFGDLGAAPHPFRVSQNGRACVIVGGANAPAVTTAVGSVAFMIRSVYVDYDNNFREVANAARRYKSGARTVGLYQGELVNRLYGWYDGPATQLEVSDDGQKVAVVYNAGATAWTTLMYVNMSATDTREELAVFRGNSGGADPYASTTPFAVTTTVFPNNYNWRIGCLAFARDGGSITFWAGLSLVGPTSFNYAWQDGCTLSGSMYAYTIGGNLVGMLPFSQGGHIDITTSKVYNVGTPNNFFPASYTNQAGAMKPCGSFLSNDGKFYWIENVDALDSSNITSHRLVGVNLSAATINTRAPLLAFAPSWPSAKPFSIGTSYPYAYPGLYYYGGGMTQRVASHISVGTTNGLVFYAGAGQTITNTNKMSSTTGWSGGSNGLNTGWNHYYADANSGAELFGFDASLGGSPTQLTTLGATLRGMPYIQPSYNGTRVAFQTTPITSANLYEQLPGSEQLRIVSGITVAATGALSAGSPVVIEAANSRLSSSLAIDSTNTKVYYGVSTNGNENGMSLKEATLNPAGSSVTGTRTFPGITGGIGVPTAHFAVLWSGR